MCRLKNCPAFVGAAGVQKEIVSFLWLEGTVIVAVAIFRWDFHVNIESPNTLSLREKRGANREKARPAPRKSRANRGKTRASREKSRANRAFSRACREKSRNASFSRVILRARHAKNRARTAFFRARIAEKRARSAFFRVRESPKPHFAQKSYAKKISRVLFCEK